MYVTKNSIFVEKRPEGQDDQVRHLVGGGVICAFAYMGHPVNDTL